MKYTLHPVTMPIGSNITLTGGPTFDTTLFRNAAGDAQPQINQEEALWNFQFNFIRESTAYDTITSFFLARRGMGYAFWVQDPFDHTDSDNGGTGRVKTMLDGNKYLVKEYADDFAPYYRIIRGADSESIEYSGVSGTPVYEPGTGKVTGATSDGNASFEFLVPVAFSTDVFEIERNAAIGTVSGIRMAEVRDFLIAS